MNTDFFFLSPVEVVRVTKGNMKEVVQWCGGKLAQTESKHQKGRMDDYVWVPTPEGNNISQAFPGMFVTKRLVISQKGELKATFAVFRRDYFEKNYWDTVEKAVDATWERAEREAKRVRREDVAVTVNVGDALEKAMDRVRELETKLEAAGVLPADEDEVDLTRPTPLHIKGKIHKVSSEPVPKEALDQGADPFPEGVPEWKHNHPMSEICTENGCKTDRYVDGLHFFTDQTAYCEPGKEPKLTRLDEVDTVNAITG